MEISIPFFPFFIEGFPYLDTEKESNRLYKIRIRNERSEAAHEYEIINNLLCMRKLRMSRNGKEHLLDNLAAKRGMRLAADDGCIQPFQHRKSRDIKEIDLWREFAIRGTSYFEILYEKKPDMAKEITKINEENRRKREEINEAWRVQKDQGYWDFNYNLDRWEWTGINPPGPEDPDPNLYVGPTFEEWHGISYEKWKEMALKEDEEKIKQDKERKNRKAREYYHKKKEELKKPIDMPEMEMSEYEKIRERNIKEREEAMKAAGLDFKMFV